MNKGIVDWLPELLKPQAPLWACEITSKHVVVAGVNKQRSMIHSKLSAEIAPGSILNSLADANIRDREGMRSGVKKVLDHAGFKGSEITVVVPDETTRVAFVTAEKPSSDPEEQRTFIRWKLKKTVPFDVDTAQVAFRVIGGRNGSGVEMLVALSPQSIVREYEDLFDSLDLHAGLVLPSTLAALNLLDVPAADTLFLKIAPDCITTTVFQQKNIRFYRRVTELSVYDAVYPTVMYYQDKLGGKALEHLIVCGYDSDVQWSVAEVQEKLGLRPQRLEPRPLEDIFKPVLGAVHLSHPENSV